MYIMYRLPKILSIILLVFLFSCKTETDSKELDLSHISVDIKINRFEKDLFTLQNSDSIEEGLNELNEKYGLFYHSFTEEIIKVGNYQDPAMPYYLKMFLNDKNVLEAYNFTMDKYASLESVEADFIESFKYAKHYMPEKRQPKLVSFYSHFNYPIVVYDSLLAIPLEKYLGSNCEYYDLLTIPGYKKVSMNQENIITDAMSAWVNEQFNLKPSGTMVLDEMIYYGKLLYALDLLTPFREDSIKIGYSAEHLKWCFDNEPQVWEFLMQKELIFSSDAKNIKKYIGEGPFTPGFPDGSPGKIGHWVGWQIVRKYAENTDLPLQKILLEENSQKILQVSKYKPSK